MDKSKKKNKSKKEAAMKTPHNISESEVFTKLEGPDKYYMPYILTKDENESCIWFKKNLQTNLKLNNDKLANQIKTLKPEHWKYSGILRHHTLRAMGLNLFMDITDTIIVVYKIKDISHEDREVIYNISYININPKNKDLYFDKEARPIQLPPESSHGNLYINNICPSNSSISKDGEYRSVLIYWRFVEYMLSHDSDLNALYNDMINYFTDKFQDRKLNIYPHYYFPTDTLRKKYSFELELMMANRKIKFFAISWFLFYYAHNSGLISNHINQIYLYIMLKYKHEDIAFFKSLIKTHSQATIRYLSHILNTNIRSTKDRGISSFCKIKLGQKFIPISLREIQYPFDITYKPWKEYLIGITLSDLIVNNITAGFPLMTNWLFIKNTDQHLFDNPSQYSRMEKSVYAVQIANILAQARYLAADQTKPSNVLLIDEEDAFELRTQKKNKKLISSWLSREFQVLHDGIDDDIKHAQLHIIMSNVSFCMFTEYVGRTLYETIFLTKKSVYYKELVNDLFSEKGYPHFERFMFELAYNLHCLSSKYGIIHSDLHLHNITLNPLFYKMWTTVEDSMPKVLYVIEPDNSYIFDTNFYYMTIIDFSRSIMDPSRIHLFKHPTLHKTFDIVDNIKDFEYMQQAALLQYLYSCKPEYKQHALALQAGIKTHFDIYFRILSILDLYMIMLRLLDFLQLKNNDIVEPYKGCIQLVKKIFSECDLYLSQTLKNLLDIQISATEPEQTFEYPIHEIIKKIFSHKIFNDNEDINNIVDIYNYNNNITYSLNRYEQLPDIFEHLSKNKNNDKFIQNSLKRRIEFDNQQLANYKTLLYIQKRQREKNV